MIEELRRFLLVAQTRHITKSAQMLFITQSALTQSIKRLEKEIGAKLLIQKGKNLYLTPDGESLVTIGEKIVTLWANAKSKDKRLLTKPTYTIGLFDNAAIRLGNYFQQKVAADDFSIDLVIDSSSNLFSQLRLGVIDIAICVVPLEKSLQQEFVCVETFEERLLPVVAKDNHTSLKKIPFILYNNGSTTRKYIEQAFRRARIHPQIYAESTSTTFMKELARLGCGVALLPKNVVQYELQQKSLVIKRFPIQWQRTYGVYLPKNSIMQNHPLAEDIIKALKKP